MNTRKLAAIILIIGGVLGLAYGGFSYTQTTHQADLGPVHLSLAEKKHVNIPLWAGIGAIIVGGLLLGFGRPK